MKIVGNAEFKGEIDCKRFYLSGITLKDVCPKCDTEWKQEGYQLSYPSTDENLKIYLYCDNCNCEWLRYLRLTLKAEVVTP